jgi:hypothetical protein
MINIHWGRICGYGYPPEKSVINILSFRQLTFGLIALGEYRSFTIVSISIFTLTNRTQHRGAKQSRR